MHVCTCVCMHVFMFVVLNHSIFWCDRFGFLRVWALRLRAVSGCCSQLNQGPICVSIAESSRSFANAARQPKNVVPHGLRVHRLQRILASESAEHIGCT